MLECRAHLFAKRLTRFWGYSVATLRACTRPCGVKGHFRTLRRALNASYGARVATQVAAGICTPEYLRRVKRPSPDAGAFFMPAFGGRTIVRCFMAGGVREPQGSRSSGRSANRAPSAASICAGVAVTHYLRAAS